MLSGDSYNCLWFMNFLTVKVKVFPLPWKNTQNRECIAKSFVDKVELQWQNSLYHPRLCHSLRWIYSTPCWAVKCLVVFWLIMVIWGKRLAVLSCSQTLESSHCLLSLGYNTTFTISISLHLSSVQQALLAPEQLIFLTNQNWSCTQTSNS